MGEHLVLTPFLLGIAQTWSRVHCPNFCTGGVRHDQIDLAPFYFDISLKVTMLPNLPAGGGRISSALAKRKGWFSVKSSSGEATLFWQFCLGHIRGEICHCRHCRRQCKFFANGVNFSIFTHLFVFFLTKTVEIRWNWWCKIFSPKIRRCKIFDKFHVCPTN